MLIECQNCGAPLDVRPRDKIVSCRYCKRQNRVNQTRTIAQQTPQGWQPPQRWVPPQHFPAPSVEIQFDSSGVASGARTGCIVGLAMMIVLIGAAVAMFVIMADGSSSSGGGLSGLSGLTGAAGWDGKSTLQCGTNESLTIENKVANVPNGPVVQADTNCKLTIINSKLSGQTGIAGDMNLTVTMRQSSISATQTGISTRMNSKIFVRDNSTVSGKEFGIKGDVSTQVEIRASHVSSNEVGISGGPTLNVMGRDCTIKGGSSAIRGGMAAKIDLTKCTVTGSKDVGLGSTVNER